MQILKKTNEKTQRDVQFELIRVIAILMVIALHVFQPEFQGLKEYNSFGWIGTELFQTILYTCNGLFFMISGKFAIGENNHTIPGVRTYYSKKVVSILVPFICYTIVYFLVYNRSIIFSQNLYKTILLYGKELLVTYPGNVFWFVYSLMGMILMAPFYSKMIHSMIKREVKALIIVAFLIQSISIYVPLLGFSLPISFPISGFVFYFILGAVLDRIWTEKKERKIILFLGGIMLIITLIQKYLFPNAVPGIHDIAPTMVFITSSIYLFLKDVCIIKKDYLKIVVLFMGKYTFSIYLLHWSIKDIIRAIFPIEKRIVPLAIHLSINFLMVLIFTLILAVFFDKLIIHRIQKLFQCKKDIK